MKYNYIGNDPWPLQYKYRGYVGVTTFGLDPNKNDSFDDSVDFDLSNIMESREAGIKWYVDTLTGLEKVGKYFLPFASPSDFIPGKHAAYSVKLSLIEYYDGDENEYILLGEDEGYSNDTLQIEEFVFIGVGIKQLLKQLNDFKIIINN